MTGLTVRAGRLTAVAADDPAAAVALADRLGRYVVSGATWGGVPLAEVALDEVRARILVADHDSYLFAGTLRDTLRAGADDGERVGAALRTASAEDVVDALPAGLETPIDARARTLSGGQRQRIRLAGRWAASRRCSSSSTRPRRWTRTPRRGSPSGCGPRGPVGRQC
ncbi:ABC transporter ATP-binding protein [Micromonospora sp. M12]